MMRIELSINGDKIADLAVWNRQEYRENEVRYEIYDLRDVEEDGHLRDHEKIGELWHDRRDGASGLTARVMKEIDEKEFLDPIRQ